MSDLVKLEEWSTVEQNFSAWPVEIISAKALMEKLEKLLDNIEGGDENWRCPWSKGMATSPRNWGGHLFKRGNLFMTMIAGYSLPWWFTIKQINDLGGRIRKGEHSTIIVAWPPPKKELQADGTEKLIRFAPRYYKEWNAEQVDWPDEVMEKIKKRSPEAKTYENSPIEEAEKVLGAMPNAPAIKEGFERACYKPLPDEIELPKLERFESAEEYYSTKAHELVHSTGHKSRLNRPSITEQIRFGNEKYCFEELVAELGAFVLLAQVGIDNKATQWNSAAYVRGWLKRLKTEPKALVVALRQAQKAAEYILKVETKPDSGDTKPEEKKPEEKKPAKKRTSKKPKKAKKAA